MIRMTICWKCGTTKMTSLWMRMVKLEMRVGMGEVGDDDGRFGEAGRRCALERGEDLEEAIAGKVKVIVRNRMSTRLVSMMSMRVQQRTEG